MKTKPNQSQLQTENWARSVESQRFCVSVFLRFPTSLHPIVPELVPARRDRVHPILGGAIELLQLRFLCVRRERVLSWMS